MTRTPAVLTRFSERGLFFPLLGLFICAVTFFIFQSAIPHNFVFWDDQVNVVENPHIRGFSRDQWVWMWTAFHKGHFTPLAWVSLAVDHALWGMNPAGYHATNVFLHAVNAALVFGLARRLLALGFPAAGRLALGGGAAVAALVFSLHPLRVESVAWVTQRRDVLAALFLLLSLRFYLRFAEASAGTRGTPYGLSLLFYTLSLLSKSVGMVFPAALVALDFHPLRRFQRPFIHGLKQRIVEKLPYFLLAVPAAVLAGLAQKEAGAAISYQTYPLANRLMQMGYGAVFYLEKTLWPQSLAALYDFPAAAPFSVTILWRALFVVGVTVGLWVRRRSAPALLVCWVVYLLFIAPTSGLYQSGGQFVADRYSYLACLPWAFLAGGAGVWCFSRSRVWGGGFVLAAGVVLSLLGAATRRQISTWADSRSLWTQILRVNPDSARARIVLAQIALEQDRPRDAVVLARDAAARRPGDPHLWSVLGGAWLADHHPAEAAAALERAFRIQPDLRDAADLLGAAYFQLGRYGAAWDLFRRAAAENPGSAPAAFNAGLAAKRLGRNRDARAHFERALALDPGLRAAADHLADLDRRARNPPRKGR